jgi:hypothetical protein
MVDWSSGLFWSIDPGESKCGVAIFSGGRCVQAVRSTPDECLDKLWEHLGFAHSSTRPAGVVLERFALFGHLAAMQTGSEMGTPQMIGAIRWMCRNHEVPLVMQTPQNAHSLERSEPWAGRPLRWWRSFGQGRDSKMAELHGYHRIANSFVLKADKAEWLAGLD